ncbi:hypothetical protein [Edaphocola aurantiacus]|uniref:hypothetical protein n=1 Tax=Edaphocola aurantiacus TaxID=2601682 RepID=UPI001C964A16|nr:hypothetical protein [Edaphocola aurantiacus]
MYEIKARAEFQDDEPVTAYITLKRKFIDINIEVPYRKTNQSITSGQKSNGIKSNCCSKKRCKCVKETANAALFIPVKFEIKNVTVEFEDGGIKNIFADLLPVVNEYTQVYGTNTIRFRNNKPISITGKFDPDRFSLMRIYSGNTRELINTLYKKATQNIPDSSFVESDFINSKSHNAYFMLSNILDYKVVSETDNEDYSPTNCKVELSEPNSIVELKKEKRSRILTARAYTDFRGLSDNEPNGLVQIEVSKKINILTGKVEPLSEIVNENGIYGGMFAFIEPRLSLNKIEENNRYLYLDSFDLDKNKSLVDSTNHFTLNPLKVLQYQQWSFGMDLNLFKLNLQNRKLNFQLNGNFAYGSTPVADSLKIIQGTITQLQSQNISRVNTTSYGFGIMCEIKPDSRYGLSFGYDRRWIDISNKRFEYNDMFANAYNTVWFNVFFKINTDSKMFWRFRRNWLLENNKYNFYQIQLGYELDIFKASN